ncbi:HutD family protein [Pseudomonas typographi]|uniref:HutD/Ves family protein n=1 Tax=Pseudomonas typographi TaxID=2715964 RepID=UPI0016879CB0|nr:HutD family protein [Pseudomonas typographi]MBD1551638.1 HutD family protein [Pseudomonas typographi]
MNPLTVLRAGDYPCMPWKNGGGSTQEITRDGGAGLDGFGWRLSIADIAASGGFSRFAGYQRVITVLQGQGMQLTVDGAPSRVLRPFDAFAFNGDSDVACQLLGGPIRDFNLIYAPSRYRARLQWFEHATPQRLFSAAANVLVFSAADALKVSQGEQAPQLLGLYDCAQMRPSGGLVELTLEGHCCVVELSPR